jgi:hypothetical protein
LVDALCSSAAMANCDFLDQNPQAQSFSGLGRLYQSRTQRSPALTARCIAVWAFAAH